MKLKIIISIVNLKLSIALCHSYETGNFMFFGFYKTDANLVQAVLFRLVQEGGCSCLPARSSSHYVAAEVVAAGCSQGDATAHIPAWRNRAQHSPTMADISHGDGSVKAKALHCISYIKMQLWHFTLALSRTVWRQWVHLKWLSFHHTSSRIAINNPDFFINDACNNVFLKLVQ